MKLISCVKRGVHTPHAAIKESPNQRRRGRGGRAKVPYPPRLDVAALRLQATQRRRGIRRSKTRAGACTQLKHWVCSCTNSKVGAAFIRTNKVGGAVTQVSTRAHGGGHITELGGAPAS